MAGGNQGTLRSRLCSLQGRHHLPTVGGGVRRQPQSGTAEGVPSTEQPGRPVENAVTTEFLLALEPLRLKLKPGGPASLLFLTAVAKSSWRNPILEKILSEEMA